MELNSDSHSTLPELRAMLSFECFCKVFERFVKQADDNAITGKSNGKRCPECLASGTRAKNGKLIVDGHDLGQQFGQGHASNSPYFNYGMVSIYYIPTRQKVILGIEANEERYFSFDKQFRNNLPKHALMEIDSGKRFKVAVFNEYNKQNADYQKLYDSFLTLCEIIYSS